MNIEEILHNELTEDQYNTVIDNHPEVLCLACAGSGKSRTLAFRISRLIYEGVAPESIIAFSRKFRIGQIQSNFQITVFVIYFYRKSS